MRKFHHLTWNQRLQIEAMLKAKLPVKDIARIVGVHISTIYNERKRGQYTHLNTDYTEELRYSPDIAEQRYRYNLQGKGAPLKIGNDYDFYNFMNFMICQKRYSPAAALAVASRKHNFKTRVCISTVYNYMHKHIFDLPKDLNRVPRKRVVNHQPAAKRSRGVSIEERPKEIDLRLICGHWEMDTVQGKQGTHKCFLVLTERKSRYEIVLPLKQKTIKCVVSALNGLERRYGAKFKQIFKTITVDNGCEFSDYDGMRKSILSKGFRTTIFYCHPYSSWDRGSNENLNKMIRRFYPKGISLERVTSDALNEVQEYINDYPRGIHNYDSAKMVIMREFPFI